MNRFGRHHWIGGRFRNISSHGIETSLFWLFSGGVLVEHPTGGAVDVGVTTCAIAPVVHFEAS